jgi:hypothetical protein
MPKPQDCTGERNDTYSRHQRHLTRSVSVPVDGLNKIEMSREVRSVQLGPIT